jgi:hypothetical protein
MKLNSTFKRLNKLGKIGIKDAYIVEKKSGLPSSFKIPWVEIPKVKPLMRK